MRIRAVRSKGGNVVVLMVLALPLMLAALALVVDIGRIAVARARLSAAADRAAYAGAQSLARSLNGIAEENWRINKAFRDLDGIFTPGTQPDAKASRQKIDEYEAERDDAIASIDAQIAQMQDRARLVAAETLYAQEDESVADIRIQAEAEMDAYDDPDDQWEVLHHDSTTGTSYADPESTEGGEYDALKYLKKRSSSDALIGISAEEEVRPLMLRAALGESISVYAESAAQAFGGSAEDFALKAGDSLDDAESFVDADGYDALYRASIVPNWIEE